MGYISLVIPFGVIPRVLMKKFLILIIIVQSSRLIAAHLQTSVKSPSISLENASLNLLSLSKDDLLDLLM